MVTKFSCPKLLKKPLTTAEKRLLEIYPNLSAPAINYEGQGYFTFQRTITPEEAIAYWRDEKIIIATRPYSGVTHDIRIDLDKGGRYWSLDEVHKLQGLFEDYGLPGSFLCRSSNSDGRWLIIPLPEAMKSWQVSLTVDSILRTANYDIEAGHLEICPNVKRWTNRGRKAPYLIKSDWIVDHHAFRLPCQQGFEILDNDGNTIGLNLEDYVHHWDWAKSQQCLDEWQDTIEYFAKKENRPKLEYRQRGIGISVIEQEHQELLARGFTDAAQTNEIGLDLARRNRILYPGDLEEQAERIKADFLLMPGYRNHCHHQHHIDQRSTDLARWADKNWSYWGDRSSEPRISTPHPNRNEMRHRRALDRGLRVLKGFLANGFSYSSKNRVFEAVQKHCGFGKKTFFKYLKENSKFANFVTRLIRGQKSQQQGFQRSNQKQFTRQLTKRKYSLGPNCFIRNNLHILSFGDLSVSAYKDLSSTLVSLTRIISNRVINNQYVQRFTRSYRYIQRSPNLDCFYHQFSTKQLQIQAQITQDFNVEENS